jgi:hypothetical protein
MTDETAAQHGEQVHTQREERCMLQVSKGIGVDFREIRVWYGMWFILFVGRVWVCVLLWGGGAVTRL